MKQNREPYLTAISFKISRISVSNNSSLVGGGGTKGAAIFLRIKLFMPLTSRKMIKARIIKLIKMVRKFP